MKDRANERVRTALRSALILSGGFMLIELGVGLWSGSLALTSDAAHMFGDSAALALAYWVAELVRRPASHGRTYGLLRAEALGAFTNGLFLVGAALLIIVHAVERVLAGGAPFPALPVLIVAVLGLLINLLVALLLARADPHSLNIRGALLHVLADALGSLGAIVAAALAWAFELHLADPLISLGIAALVLLSAFNVLRAAARALLDFTPSGVDERAIESALTDLPGVAAVHELHLWGIGRQALLTAHLVPTATPAPGPLLDAATNLLRDQFGITHSTLQIDATDDPAAPCAQRECPLFRGDPAPIQLHHHAHGHGHAHHDHSDHHH